MTYIQAVFDVNTLDQAKNVVLTDDPTDLEKFDNETKFLVNAVAQKDIINSKSIVLDFGCGMGRVSKSLIDKFDCNVIGVDISLSMMRLADTYVGKPDRFQTMRNYNVPNSIDVCISSFVLQHVENPRADIERICNNLKSGGYLVLVNEHTRFVPAEIDHNKYVIWKDDGFDVFGEIGSRLSRISSVQYMDSPIDIVFYKKL